MERQGFGLTGAAPALYQPHVRFDPADSQYDSESSRFLENWDLAVASRSSTLRISSCSFDHRETRAGLIDTIILPGLLIDAGRKFVLGGLNVETVRILSVSVRVMGAGDVPKLG